MTVETTLGSGAADASPTATAVGTIPEADAGQREAARPRETSSAGSQSPTEATEPTAEVETPGADNRQPKGHREARYRTERNDARAERDALAQRIATLHTREVERLASKSLSNPADLLTLGGVTLADLLDDNGDVNAEKVSEVVADVLGTRPGLKVPARPVDMSQGLGNDRPGKRQPTFADLLRT